jgi:hypothetical protein
MTDYFDVETENKLSLWVPGVFDLQREVSTLDTNSPCSSEYEFLIETQICCSSKQHTTTNLNNEVQKTKTFREMLGTLPFKIRTGNVVYQCPHCHNYYAENGMYSQFVLHF